MGGDCDDDDDDDGFQRSQVQFATDLTYLSCQIELGKLFSWNVGRSVASSFKNNLQLMSRQALEGSASYVLDEDLCPQHRG